MSCPVHRDSSAGASPPQPTHGELQEIPQPSPKYFKRNLSEIDPSFLAKSFWRLADVYGPIFKLDMIARTIIVASSYELINELCDQDRFDKSVPG